MRVLGECRPGGLFGCRPVPSRQQLGNTRLTLDLGPPIMVELYNSEVVLPAGSVDAMMGLFLDPYNSTVAMLHWRQGEVLAFQKETVELVLTLGMDYPQLVKQLDRFGFSVLDVEL